MRTYVKVSLIPVGGIWTNPYAVNPSAAAQKRVSIIAMMKTVVEL